MKADELTRIMIATWPVPIEAEQVSQAPIICNRRLFSTPGLAAPYPLFRKLILTLPSLQTKIHDSFVAEVSLHRAYRIAINSPAV